MNQENRKIDLKEALSKGDWKSIHFRLKELREFLDKGSAPTKEECTETLKSRALALAKTYTKEEPDDNVIHVITFMLANETYALETKFIDEVSPLTDLTPVPCSPPFVLGIISIHSQIFSVIDLRDFFDLEDFG